MVTRSEAAVMSTAVYRPDAGNDVSVPGWSILNQVVQSPYNFGATAYMRGNEIVIAYRGTDEKADFIWGNIPAALGLPSAEIKEAMEFYVRVRQQYPNAAISLTGHSLGAGLASLMAVYFDVEARVFDNAPFAVSAQDGLLLQHYQHYLEQLGFANAQFDAYVVNYNALFAQRLARVVSTDRVDGEVLENISPDILKLSPQVTEYQTYGNAASDDLHSIRLLTTLITSKKFADAVRESEDILPLAFAKDRTIKPVDFWTRLVQGITKDGAASLDKFADDLVAIEGGGQINSYRRALTMAAIEYYYWRGGGADNALFTVKTGGVAVDLGDINSNTVDSTRMLSGVVRAQAQPDELDLLPDLKAMPLWYIQQGSNGLDVTDAEAGNTVAVGGSGSDHVVTGEGDDVLIGNDGKDELDGGEGNDLLLGGADADRLNGGNGNDTVLGGTGNDDINGGEGNDSLLGGNGKDILSGGDGIDTLRGEAGDDGLLGYGGNDLLEGGEGSDRLDGGADNDTLRGEAGNDTLTGDDGSDQLVGGAGDDVLYGNDGEGGDVLIGGIGRDIYYADDGDTIYDEDGQGEIWLNGKRLTEATRKKGETLYHDDAGNTYQLQGDRLLINDPLVVSGFSSGKLGIVLKEDDDDDDDPHDPPGKDLFRNSMLTSDPLVLDLDGGGVATRGIGAGAFFDYDGNGFAERTAWVGGGEGILVRDLDGDGKINRGAELFGDKTVLASGALATDGYAALSALDSDNNGLLDHRDIAWAELKVWRDVNGDGVSSVTEMASLDDAGVKSVKLSATGGSGIDQHFNDHKLVSTFTRADGSEGQTVDIWFRSNVSSTRYETPATLSADLFQLPDLRGTGNVANLLQVMAGDTSGRLETVVRQYAALSLPSSHTDLLKTVILTWAGVQDVDSASRGIYVKDARVLAALERFYGIKFFDPRVWGANPGPGAIAPLESAFSALLVDFGAALDSQTRFKPWFDQIHMRWDTATRSLAGNLDDVAAVVKTQQFDSVEQAGVVLTSFIAVLRITHTLEPFSVKAFLSALGPLGAQLTSTIVSAWEGTGVTEGNDRIIGKETNDLLFGVGGNDYINGGSGDDTINGGGGDDQLDGHEGDDVLSGGVGDDLLRGAAGNDTIMFGVGDGRDTVQNGGLGEVDRLQFLAGITAENITVQRNWDNLTLSRSGSTDSVVILDYFAANAGQTVVQFADGAVWDASTIEAMLTLAGTANADYLMGFEGADTILGSGGDDTILGRGENDFLLGGDGDDNIDGGTGNDLLRGGAGNDVLNGGAGADVYLYGIGDGRDAITDVYYFDGSVNEVRFDDTINADQLQITRDYFGLIVSIDNQPRLTINNDATLTLVFRFADGVTWDSRSIIQRVEATDGDDHLEADSATLLDGAAGNDTLDGSSGDDTLVGGAGNDVMNGRGGNDVFLYSLGDGIDGIRGWTNGTLRLGAGIEADSVLTRSVRYGRVLYFSDGGTVRFDTQQNLRVEFEDGTAWDTADLDARFMAGTAYDDVLYATSVAHPLEGKAGNDTLQGSSAANTLIGGEGDDELSGGGGADVIRFARGDGRDVINSNMGGVGDTVIEFAPSIVAEDVALVRQYGLSVSIRIRGSTDSITLTQTSVLPAIRFADGTTWNSQMVWDRSMLGTEFDDYLTSDVGGASLDGQAGNDTLKGDASSNTLIGGDGNDGLSGGMGDDIYVYSRGQDYIEDLDYIANPDANNILRFDVGVKPSDIRVEMSGGRMSVVVRDRGAVSLYKGISRFEFADGTVLTYADMVNLSFIGGDGNDMLQSDGADRIINGGGGDDTLYAGAGAETLIGGTGNDLLIGSGGNDVFLYARGDGNDRVLVGYGGKDHSVLRFQPGIDPAAVQVARSGQDVILTIAPDASQITLVDWFNPARRLDRFAFADGTIWSAQEILKLFMTGTSADDVLAGTSGDDLLSGEGGNDQLSDWQGNDTFVGGTGDDWMQGSSDNNVYLYRLGDGVDEINDNGGIDELRFDATISVSDVTVWRDRSSILLSIADGGAIKISSYYESNYPIERIAFADGTIWTAAQLLATPIKGAAGNDQLYGSAFGDSMDGGAGDDYIVGQNGADTITGGLGNDDIVGGAGDDVYRFERGDGHDVIYDAPGERNVLQLGAGISVGDVQFRRDAGNVYLTVSGMEDGIAFYGWTDEAPRIDRIEFADGTALSAAAIWAQINQPSARDDWLAMVGETTVHALEGNDTVTGSSQNNALYGDQGNDVLGGGAGADLIVGGSGNDTMNGGGGDDVYLVDAGDGRDVIVDIEGANVVRFASGVLPGQVFLRWDDGSGVVHVYLSGEQSLQISVINEAAEALPRFEFSDGTIWDVATVSRMLLQGGDGNEWMIGTAADDIISGGAGDDSMRGGRGDDTLRGGSGHDLLAGGEGDDTYVYERGDGYDVIEFEEGGGKDTVQFGAGITAADLKFTRQSGALQIQVGGSADDSLLIQKWFGSTAWQNIELRFTGGEVLTAAQMAVLAGAQGTEADDTLSGGAWNDTLSGGGGKDYIDGGKGDDLLSGGAGNDILNGGAGHDVYLFNRGDGRDTVYAFEDTVRFGAGITLDEIQVYREGASLVLAITGTGDAVEIWPWFMEGYQSDGMKVEFADGTVWSSDDMLQRLAFPTTEGGDMISGFEENDLINGKGGADYLRGGDGNDTLIGGLGDDTLSGDAGSDVYRYAQGDGSDRYKFETVGGVDRLELGEGVSATDIVMSRDLKNLYLRLGASGESITLEGWFGEDGYAQGQSALSRIVFANGTMWTPASTALRISAVTSGDLFVLGGAADETLVGYGGNDMLYGGAGNDTLDAGTGTNLTSGGAGNDVYRYSGGVLTIADWSAAVGEQDRLEITGIGPGGLTLSNSAGNLDIVDGDGNLVIRIVAYFEMDGNGEFKSGDIAFADGTIWTRESVAGMLPLLVATEDRDELRLTTPGVIDGLGGGDHIVGVSNSTLHGGDGNDYLEIVGVGNDAIFHGDNGDDRLQIDSGARDLLYGDAGNDGLLVRNGSGMMLDGGDGGDYLQLTDGDNNTLRGGADRDTILIQHGSKNWVYGDAGDDSLQVRNGSEMMIDGGVGADYLNLDDADNNTLRGGAERDTMQSQYGDNNWLYGDSGDDTIRFERGGQSNHGYGGDGDDTLMGADGSVTDLYGDDGNDTLQWDRGSGQHLYGGGGNDQLQSSGGNVHLLDGGVGNDTLNGNGDNDTLLGGDGADTMTGNNIGAWMDGGDGDDTMKGNNAGAWMDGGAGNDLMNVNGANSTLIGGDGDDTLDGSYNNIVMRGGVGKDKLSANGGSFSVLDGGADDDSVNVGGGSDLTILGGEGNDTLTLGAGARNLLDGGDGDDTLQVGAYQANVVRGGAGADTIGVNYGSAQIEGGSGNDTIKTGTTNQFVAGGIGDDRITLQSGADIVAFNLGDGKDTVDGTGVTATLSLGGGVEYADLLFSREQTDLILKVGDSDQLRLKDWYNADDLHRTASQLQFILDGGSDYDAASTDALRNQRTTLFNFQQLVDTFDSAQLADPTLNAWSVTSALLSAHLGGGNADAIGGELAYQYGRSGNLDGLTMQASVALLAASEFGASRQQFQPLTS